MKLNRRSLLGSVVAATVGRKAFAQALPPGWKRLRVQSGRWTSNRPNVSQIPRNGTMSNLLNPEAALTAGAVLTVIAKLQAGYDLPNLQPARYFVPPWYFKP